MGKEVDTEKWLASLFSELIRRGLDSNEHLPCKDSPLGGSYSPNLEEIRGAHLGWVGEFLTPLLQKHLDDIVSDYQKAERKPGDVLKLKPNHGFDHREEKIYIFLRYAKNKELYEVLSSSGRVDVLPYFALELVEEEK